MQLAKGQLIGKGLTAQVHGWGDGRVLKLFESWRPKKKVEKEFAVTRAVHAAGLPAPEAHEIVEVEGRSGIIFERIDGPSMFEQVVARPWKLFAAARKLAELHVQLHSVKAPAELPGLRDEIENSIENANRLSASEKNELRRRLAALPDGDALCHGDFHPANVLMSARAAPSSLIGPARRAGIRWATLRGPRISSTLLTCRKTARATFCGCSRPRAPLYTERISNAISSYARATAVTWKPGVQCSKRRRQGGRAPRRSDRGWKERRIELLTPA
jgi:hypothetical protein